MEMRKGIMVLLGAALLAGWVAEARAQLSNDRQRVWYHEMTVPPDIDGWRHPWEIGLRGHGNARVYGDIYGSRAAGDFDPPLSAGLQGDGTARFVDTGAHGYNGFVMWGSERGNLYMRVRVNSGPTGSPGAYTFGMQGNNPGAMMTFALDTDGIRIVSNSGTVASSGTIDMTTWRVIRIQQDNRDTVTGGTSNVNYMRLWVDDVSDNDTPVFGWTQMNQTTATSPMANEAMLNGWSGFYYFMASDTTVTNCDIVVDWLRQTFANDRVAADPTYHPHGLIPAQTNRVWDKRMDMKVYPHYPISALAAMGDTTATPGTMTYQVINTSFNNPNTQAYTVTECDSAGNATDYSWITLDKSGGSLAANQGALDTVTVTLNSNVSSLAAGTYDAYIKLTPSFVAPPAVPGITVWPPTGLATNENGTTAQFTVVLDTQPTADVVVPIVSGNTNEGTVDKASLTFTSSDWDTPQTVSVTGVDDAVVGDRVVYSILVGPATSSDLNYNGMDPPDVTVVNYDNDAYGNFLVVTMNPQIIEVTEGGTAQFDVVLNRPIATGGTVTVGPLGTDRGGTNTINDTEDSLSTLNVVFNDTNWNVPQTVTVTGLVDGLDDGDIGWTLNIPDTKQTGDANWNARRVDQVAIISRDADPIIRRIVLVVQDPAEYLVWEYCGDVPPTQNDSAGPGLRFRRWGWYNDGTPVGGLGSGSIEDENRVEASVVADGGAWNAKALRVYNADTADGDTRCMYQSDDNAGTNDVRGVPKLNNHVGGTAVARLKIVAPTDYSVARKLGLFVTGGGTEWPKRPTTANSSDVWASVCNRTAIPDNVVLDGYRRESGYLEADGIISTGSASGDYHILRVAVVAGICDTSRDRFYRGDATAGLKYNWYGRKITMWFDEDPVPVVNVVNQVSRAEASELTTADYNGFKFGTYDRRYVYDAYYDWITLTNAGAFAPGEETAVLGRSLIPTSTRCQPCNSEYWADVDRDGDVDQDDFAQFQTCYSGNGNAYPSAPGICHCFDREPDGDVDVDDFNAFTACATGPGIAGPPEGCTP